MITIEHTDTFGGEANYCWVKRWKCAAELTDVQAIRLAKSLTGYTGHKCRKNDMGDSIALYPARVCQVIFIGHAEPEYAQGVEVDAQGNEVT